MKPIRVGKLLHVVTLLVDMSRGPTVIAPEHREYVGSDVLPGLQDMFSDYEMVCSVETVKKMIQYAKQGTEPGELHTLALELQGRVIDESRAREFFSLSTSESEVYRNPTKRWEKIVERLPIARMDIEEAQKCLALSRYAAAVFHSLQVVEVGLIELGAFIGVNDPISGWTAVAQRLKKIIDTKYPDLSEFEKSNRPFLEQLQGTVEALKNAWRNKVSHVHGKLTLMTGEEFHPDIAEEILLATRAFMRRLAEGLPRPIKSDEIIMPIGA